MNKILKKITSILLAIAVVATFVPTILVSAASSSTNYEKLLQHLNVNGKIELDADAGDGIVHTYTLQKNDSGILFCISTEHTTSSTRIYSYTHFTVTDTSEYIEIDGFMNFYYYGDLKDSAFETISIDRSTYNFETSLNFTSGGFRNIISKQDFTEIMEVSMINSCLLWDLYMYNNLGFGMKGLGFTSYDGLGDAACDMHTSYHTGSTQIRNQKPTGCVVDGYTGDEYCVSCGTKMRTGTVIECVGYHIYSHNCDPSCNTCGATRSVTHTYSSACDANCNVCSAVRTTSSNHTFNGNTACQQCNATFGDVNATGWQIAPVVYAYDRGLMAGKGTDTNGNIKFDPNNYITREEFVQVLYNAEGKPSVTIANRFPDVKNNGWYKNAVLWANSMNIASGMGNGNFGVGKNITRQDLALMLMKYAALKGCSLDAEAGKINQYADGNKVSEYAKNAMDWAVTNRVLSGKGAAGAPPAELNLDPTGTATRAECAAMLKNFMFAFGL